MTQALAVKFEHTELVEKERVASVPQESSWQVRHSRLCQEEKEQSCPSKAPDRMVGESQGERELHPGEKEGDQSWSMEREFI